MLLSFLLASGTVLASVSWGGVHTIGAKHTWNNGMALARSTSSSSTYLHAVYTADVINGVPVSDSGPHVGIYYRRGDANGSTWGTPKRINASIDEGINPTVAARGKMVYVAWVDIDGSWVNYDPSTTRQIFLRVNNGRGAAANWYDGVHGFGEVPGGRVDRPALAPYGDDELYVTWTNANNGDIMFGNLGGLSVQNSGCGGCVYKIASTSNLSVDPADGYAGLPVVAAVGKRVAVAWISNTDGTVKFKMSNDHGTTWSSPKTLESAGGSDVAITAKSDRFAVSWVTADALKLKMWSSGWHTTRTVATFTSGATYKAGYAPAIALAGTSAVGVAWAACRRSDCTASDTTGVDLRWRESTTNGSTWKPPKTVASYAESSSRRINDYPSVLMPGTSKRIIEFNVANKNGGDYAVKVRAGSGSL